MKAGCERHCANDRLVKGGEENGDDIDEDMEEFTSNLDDIFGPLIGSFQPTFGNNRRQFRFRNANTRLNRMGFRTRRFLRQPKGLFTNPFFNSFNPLQGIVILKPTIFIITKKRCTWQVINAGSLPRKYNYQYHSFFSQIGNPASTRKNNRRKTASPFSDILDLFHQTPLKPLGNSFSRSTVKLQNLFTRPLGPKSFQSVFTKTMQSIGDDFDKSVKTMTTSIVTSGEFQNFACVYYYLL